MEAFAILYVSNGTCKMSFFVCKRLVYFKKKKKRNILTLLQGIAFTHYSIM